MWSPLIVQRTASHRFNLALDDIHKVMVELRKLKNAARLRSLTDLCAVKNNETRWSSKYEMAKRYIRLKDKINDIVEVENLLLSRPKRRLLDQSITLSLQK